MYNKTTEATATNIGTANSKNTLLDQQDRSVNAKAMMTLATMTTGKNKSQIPTTMIKFGFPAVAWRKANPWA